MIIGSSYFVVRMSYPIVRGYDIRTLENERIFGIGRIFQIRLAVLTMLLQAHITQ